MPAREQIDAPNVWRQRRAKRSPLHAGVRLRTPTCGTDVCRTGTNGAVAQTVMTMGPGSWMQTPGAAEAWLAVELSVVSDDAGVECGSEGTRRLTDRVSRLVEGASETKRYRAACGETEDTRP